MHPNIPGAPLPPPPPGVMPAAYPGPAPGGVPAPPTGYPGPQVAAPPQGYPPAPPAAPPAPPPAAPPPPAPQYAAPPAAPPPPQGYGAPQQYAPPQAPPPAPYVNPAFAAQPPPPPAPQYAPQGPGGYPPQGMLPGYAPAPAPAPGYPPQAGYGQTYNAGGYGVPPQSIEEQIAGSVGSERDEAPPDGTYRFQIAEVRTTVSPPGHPREGQMTWLVTLLVLESNNPAQPPGSRAMFVSGFKGKRAMAKINELSFHAYGFQKIEEAVAAFGGPPGYAQYIKENIHHNGPRLVGRTFAARVVHEDTTYGPKSPNVGKPLHLVHWYMSPG